MKVIKKFVALEMLTENVNDRLKVELSYGEIEGPYYSLTYPDEEFDTEEEAIKHAYNINRFGKWMIVPVIKFDNYDH
jgi:hypothetical protein